MFSEKLSLLLEKAKNEGKTATQIAAELEVAKARLSDWKAGRYIPSFDNIQKIANFFNVPVSFLVDTETPSGEILGDGNVATNVLTPQEQELVRLFRNLPVKDQTHFLAELYKKEDE